MSTKDEKKEKPVPRSMTVGQYLERFPKPGIDGLIRSLYSKKTASKEEWEKIINDLKTRSLK
jgi:hypothetical protein